MKKNIFIAGHQGMVGSAITRELTDNSLNNIITRSRNELNLADQKAVSNFFKNNAIDEVYLAAAKVGGIQANSRYPADFLYENIMIQANVIHQAYRYGVKRLLFLGSSCIYPRLAKQPMKESALMTSALEPTNEPYAIAKIAGIKLCESYNRQHNVDYRSVMPTNLYGSFDNFHLEDSHVVPALIRRFHEAKVNQSNEVVIWGSGRPLREFLHVDDMAKACVFVMELSSEIYQENTQAMQSHINVGTGQDCSIHELATIISEVIGFNGEITFDKSKPDGSPRKLMDVSRINNMGWSAKISLYEGLKNTYRWFLEHQGELRA